MQDRVFGAIAAFCRAFCPDPPKSATGTQICTEKRPAWRPPGPPPALHRKAACQEAIRGTTATKWNSSATPGASGNCDPADRQAAGLRTATALHGRQIPRRALASPVAASSRAA